MRLELGQIPQDGAEGRPLAGAVAQAAADERGQLLAGRLGEAMPLLVETLFLRERKQKEVSNGAGSVPERWRERSREITSEGVRSLSGTSASKQISSKVVPKLHLSAAVLRLPASRTHSGAIQGIRSTRSLGEGRHKVRGG